MRRAQRLAVFVVDAEERHVERVARIGEVVRVAAEVAQLQLGRHHQPHVAVAFEDVGRVFGAVVERDHLDDVAGLLPAFFFQQPLLDLLNGLLAGHGPFGVRLGPFQRGIDFIGHVADFDELVGVVVFGAALFFERAGVEAVVEQVFAGSADGHDGFPTAVVVRHHQPVGRDERGRAARNAQRAQPGFPEPGRVGPEAVGLGEVVDGRIVERPHLAVVEAPGPHRVERGDHPRRKRRLGHGGRWRRRCRSGRRFRGRGGLAGGTSDEQCQTQRQQHAQGRFHGIPLPFKVRFKNSDFQAFPRTTHWNLSPFGNIFKPCMENVRKWRNW